MPIIEAAGAAIYYEEAGKGEPLVLIPGFASGIWSWFCQDELSNNLRTIFYDPRGVGKSQVNSAGDSSLTTFVEDVLAVIDGLNIEKAHILGASFGGFVAQEFALRFPSRVNKLVLACTSAGGADHVRPEAEILRSFTPNPEYSVGEQIRRFFRPAFTSGFQVEHPETIEKVCRLREENEVSEETYLGQLQVAFSIDFADRLGEIKHETLVITGDCDNLVPMQNSENLAAKLPNAELKIIKGGSHMVFVENAGEFNKIVAEFVKRR